MDPARRLDADDVVLGRERELRWLQEQWRHAVAGDGGMVLLVGSRALARRHWPVPSLVKRSGQSGVPSLCTPGQARSAPFSPWVRALPSLARQLATPGPWQRVLAHLTAPDTEAAAPTPSNAAVISDIVDAILRAAWAKPLLIVLDDVHAADASSLRTLEALSRELGGSPVLIVSTCGRPPADSALEHWIVAALRRSCVRELAVGALSPEAATAFAEFRSGTRLATGTAVRYYELTGGNPLFLRELTRLADERGTVDPAQLPIRLTAALRQRLNDLGTGALNALELAAVLRSRVPVSVLRALEAFVPYALGLEPGGAPRHPGPTYRIPLLTLFGPGAGAIALGLAHAALDALAVCAARVSTASGRPGHSRREAQLAVGLSAGALRGARLGYFDAIEQLWADAADGPPGTTTMAHAWSAALHAIEVASHVVERCAQGAQNDAFSLDYDLDLIARNTRAIASSFVPRYAAMGELAGQHLLGLDVQFPHEPPIPPMMHHPQASIVTG